MNQLAKRVVDIATGEQKDDAPERGRIGGLKGGKARAEQLTSEKRREIARHAATKRWAKRD